MAAFPDAACPAPAVAAISSPAAVAGFHSRRSAAFGRGGPQAAAGGTRKASSDATAGGLVWARRANQLQSGMTTGTVEIWTDGACRGNPGPGGWGAVLRFNGVEKELSGGERETTNNRMELMAAIRALEALKKPCRVHLTTDSNYVRQ